MLDQWDGLRACEKCGNDTTGRLCHSCREQELIDDAIPPAPKAEGCPKCGAAWFDCYPVGHHVDFLGYYWERFKCDACGHIWEEVTD